MSKPEKLYCARCGIRIDGEQAIREALSTGQPLCGLCLDDLLNEQTSREQLNQAAETLLKGLHEQTSPR